MSVSAGTSIESAPPSAENLWLLSYLFSSEWEKNIAVRSAFETDVQYSMNASEQRSGLRGKPIRTLTATLQGWGVNEVGALRMLMARATVSRYLFPLFSDFTLADQIIASSDTVIHCDTTYRRLSRGMRVAMVKDSADPQYAVFEIATITAITANTITISAGSTARYEAGSFIIPLIEAQLTLTVQGDITTDTAASVNVEATEAVGDTQLAGVAGLGTTPTGFASQDGYPIFTLPINFEKPITWGFQAYGDFIDSGIDTLPATIGRGRAQFKVPILCSTRKDAWDVLMLFESRGGALYGFYVVSPLSEYVALSVTGGGTAITVVSNGPAYDWNFRPYIALELSDGTTIIRKVASVVRGASDAITFDSPVTGLTLSAVIRTTCAYLVKFELDELNEQWTTNTLMETELSFVELLNEQNFEINDLVSISTSDLQTTWRPGVCPCEDTCAGVTCNICLDLPVVLTINYFCVWCGSFIHSNCASCDPATSYLLTFAKEDIQEQCPSYSHVKWQKHYTIEQGSGDIWVILNFDLGEWSMGSTGPLNFGGFTACCDNCPPPGTPGSHGCICCVCGGGLFCDSFTPPDIDSCELHKEFLCCPFDGTVKLITMIAANGAAHV